MAMPAPSGTQPAGSTVTLMPGVPQTVATTAVSGVSFAIFTNDNTAAGGLNSLGSAVSVQLAWQASQDGVNYYEIAACSVSGGSASTSSIGVSTVPSEQQVRLTAVQPSAVGPSVAISPSAVVS